MKASNSPALILLALLVAAKVHLSFQEQLFINSNLIEKLIQIEQGGSRKPIVIVPGLLGSQLQARFDVPHPSKDCLIHHDWFLTYLNITEIMHLDCWLYSMKLLYNNVTHQVSNDFGVEIRVPGFGSTETIEYLSVQRMFAIGKYFAPLVKYLVRYLGYTRKKDVFGAPYDWRLSPRQNSDYYKNLSALIETAYEKNNKKVVLLAHSMGCPYTSYFLHKQSRYWKNKYVDSFISISGSYFGSVKSLKAIVSGDAEGYKEFINETKLREMTRSFPSFFYMSPRINNWPKNKATLVVTPNRNYTVHDYDSLFKAIGCDWCLDLWKNNGKNMDNFGAPNVPVHCIFSSGIPTIETLMYSNKFPNVDPEIKYGDGDGTVNTFSSSGCLKWRKMQKEPVFGYELYKHRHIEILGSLELLHKLKEIVYDDKIKK